MVERDEFKTLVKAMKAVYVQPTFIPDQDAFNVWFSLLRDLDYQVLQGAIQKHMMTNVFPPTIANLRENAAEIIKAQSGVEEESELDAWAKVSRAVRNSLWNSETEFQKLSKRIQTAIGYPRTLKDWASLQEDVFASVAQAQFLRSYRATESRYLESLKLNPRMRTLLGYAEPKMLSSAEPQALIPDYAVRAEPFESAEAPESLQAMKEKLRQLL